MSSIPVKFQPFQNHVARPANVAGHFFWRRSRGDDADALAWIGEVGTIRWVGVPLIVRQACRETYHCNDFESQNAESAMSRHISIGGQTSLFVGLLGLAFSCAQGCANGDTKQGDSNTGGANSPNGGSSNAGGLPNQGGSSSDNTSVTGGTVAAGGGQGGTSSSQGGANTGGANIGGVSNTVAGGGSDTGGVGIGGDTGGDVGGSTFGVGGTTAATGGAATGGTPATPCQNSLNCSSAPDNKAVCDTGAGHCVQCLTADDCTANVNIGPNHDCVSKQCVAYDPCENADDVCPNGGVCDVAKKRCVGCSKDEDCGAGKTCLSQTCRTSCASDASCTSAGLLCNKTLSVCVQCGAPNQAACTGGLVCDPTGICGPPVCTTGDKQCKNGGIASCLSDGSGYGNPRACPPDSTCQEPTGAPACYNAEGGVVKNCNVTGDPCQEITEFTDTQKLDGLGDDFCGIPAVVLDKTHNAKMFSYHTDPPEIATIQVAWSSAGLHVFVDVQDASVQTVQMADPSQATSKTYQGDCIELMFSSSNTGLTGLTGTDNNTLHVQIPASGPAVSIKSDGTSGTPTVLPAAQYAQKINATGYTIEARLPWPGSAPSMGATIRFDLVLDSADKNYGNVDDMRDGALIFHLDNVANTSCKSGDGTVPYCDDRTWCATPLRPAD